MYKTENVNYIGTLLAILLAGALLVGIVSIWKEINKPDPILGSAECSGKVKDRYVRAITLYDSIRTEHQNAFNVPTMVADDTATPLGKCVDGTSEMTRFLIQEEPTDNLRHYIGYAVIGNNDGSFKYYKCMGKDECEVSEWCPNPEFGPSACGESGECLGDLSFRGCTAQ